MASPEPPEHRPVGNATGGGEPGSPVGPAPGPAPKKSTPIGALAGGFDNADPAQTITHRPSGSGITAALVGSGAAVIQDQGEFARSLAENGLVETAVLESLSAQIAARNRPRDAAALARELVRYERLTPYQAAAVLQGKIKGLLIGNYVVLDKLGAGSMGIVFKARHRVLTRVVALKLLPPSLARDPSAVNRFHREAKAAAKLSHPNVVSVLDADEFRGLHFLVMEYIEGRDLARLVREGGPLPVSLALDCIIQAARGLKAAFEAAVVHRDIKPSNLMRESGGTVKILDMGLARLDAVGSPLGMNAEDASLTQSNLLLGTIDYMSPEQAFNPRNADHRSDIYSLGCTLHYLLSGRPPYSGETLIERLVAHREQAIPSLRKTMPEVPEAVDALLRRVLAKSPGGRYSSFDELIEGLEACRAGGVPAGAELSGEPAVTRKPRVRNLAVIAGVAAAVCLVLIAAFLSRRGSAQPGYNAARVAQVPVPTTSKDGPDRKSAATDPPVLVMDREKPKLEVKPKSATAAAKAGPAETTQRVEAAGVSREFRGHDRRVNSVAASGDGLLALSGGRDRTVRLWNIATGKELRRVAHDGGVNAVALSVDGRYGLSGSDDKTVRIWDFEQEHAVGMRQLEGHTGSIFTVALAVGDRLALSGGADKTIRIWDFPAGRVSGSPLLHDSAVVALAMTGDDGVLAGCDDGTMWLWDLKTRQRVRRLKAPGRVFCVACSPLGHRALSGHADGVLVLWDLDLGVEIGRMVGHADLVRCAAFLPDGRRALAGSQFGNLILWQVETRSELLRLPVAGRASEHAGQLGLAVLPDDRHLLTADTDAMVRLVSLPAIEPPTEDRAERAAP